MKGFITGTLFIVLAYISQAQVTFNQQVDFGEFGFPFHVLTSVLPTDSCYYATGIISDTTDGFFAYGGIFVKFDLQGEMLFFKKLTSPDRDYFLWRGDLVATPDGNLMDIGITVDSITRGILIKYSPQGDTLFTREYLHPFYPTESFLYAAGLKVAGTDRIMALFGVDTDTSSGISNMDSYLLTLDPLGNVLDSNIYGDNIKENPKRLVMAGDGGVLVPSIKTNSNLVNMNYVSRAHIFKVDTLGKMEWEYLTPQGQLFSFASDLALAPDGGLVAATGKGIEVMVNAETAILKWFPYFLKLDADHQFEWGREFRGTRPDLFTMDRIVAAADGSGYVGVSRIGEDVSIGEEVLGSWLMKVSPEGDSLWARYYSFFDGINARPNPYDLKNTSDGGYVICGETDPSNIGDIKDGSWLMKVDGHGCLVPGCHLPNDVGEVPENSVQLAIYPNPTMDYLNFQLRGNNDIDHGMFRIVSSGGKVMKEFTVDIREGDTFVVQVREWPVGAYFLQLIDPEANVIISKRFIKN